MSGSVTLDIEYQGQTTRVEALVSTLFEDKIFLSWRTHQSLEIVDNKLLAMIKKNINDTKPRTRNYEETKFARMERQNDHHRTNPCPDAGQKTNCSTSERNARPETKPATIAANRATLGKFAEHTPFHLKA